MRPHCDRVEWLANEGGGVALHGYHPNPPCDPAAFLFFIAQSGRDIYSAKHETRALGLVGLLPIIGWMQNRDQI